MLRRIDGEITEVILINDDNIDMMERYGLYTIDSSVVEFRNTYAEGEAYVSIPMLNGTCYQWSENFIYKILEAMATDKLTQFTDNELDIWRYFVNFQEYHSTSASSFGACNAVGCTNPDAFGNSYEVQADGTVCTVLCRPPTYEVIGEDAWKSLDEAIMAIYNCEDVNTCSSNNEVVLVNECN